MKVEVPDEMAAIAEQARQAKRAEYFSLGLPPSGSLEDACMAAALAAVIPAIQAQALERAAVVADKELADAQADMAMAGDSDPTGFQQSEGAAHAAERIQSAIRALKEGT
jgi:hypothetical protein